MLELVSKQSVITSGKSFFPNPRATPSSGYRLYPPSTIARLQFIARAKLLGFTLSETRELLDLRRVAVDCGDVRSRAQAKILQVRQKIAELHRIEGALLRLADACPGVGELDNCPILAALEQDDGDAS